MTIYRFGGVVLPASVGRDRYRPGVVDARDADLAWGDVHSELPWGHLLGNGCEHWLPNPDAAEVATCEQCPLWLEDGADCNQKDPRCPFNDDQSSTKRAYDLAYKAAKREVEKAVREIEEARCAT